MKNLVDIIEDCQANKEVHNKDLKYAVVALTIIANMASMNMRSFYKHDAKPIDKIRIENFSKTYSTALNKPPKDWLGWNNDPENPEYQKFHAWGSKLVDKAMKCELPNQKAKTEVQNG